MSVGLRLGSIIDEIGTSEFFHAFFSTISGNLEPEGWGSNFPTLLTKLYSGELKQEDANAALKELKNVKRELAKFSPEKVIWDLEQPLRRPPWGNNISPEITDLSNYFVTSTGRDLFQVLEEVIEEQCKDGGVIRVVTI